MATIKLETKDVLWEVTLTEKGAKLFKDKFWGLVEEAKRMDMVKDK